MDNKLKQWTPKVPDREISDQSNPQRWNISRQYSCWSLIPEWTNIRDQAKNRERKKKFTH